MIIFYLIAIIIGLFVNYIISKKFGEIAEMKGHDGSPYFWFTFFLGTIGMLMVIALPKIHEPHHTTTLPPAKDIFASVRDTSKQLKRCPHCGDIVKAGRCEMCGKEVK